MADPTFYMWVVTSIGDFTIENKSLFKFTIKIIFIKTHFNVQIIIMCKGEIYTVYLVLVLTKDFMSF